MSQYKDLYCDSGLVGWADSHVATRPGQAATWPAGRLRHGREGEPRHGAGRRALSVRQGRAREAATRQPGAATRPALATIQPGQGPRYGHCACTWGVPGCLAWPVGCLCT